MYNIHYTSTVSAVAFYIIQIFLSTAYDNICLLYEFISVQSGTVVDFERYSNLSLSELDRGPLLTE